MSPRKVPPSCILRCVLYPCLSGYTSEIPTETQNCRSKMWPPQLLKGTSIDEKSTLRRLEVMAEGVECGTRSRHGMCPAQPRSRSAHGYCTVQAFTHQSSTWKRRQNFLCPVAYESHSSRLLFYVRHDCKLGCEVLARGCLTSREKWQKSWA